MSITEVEHLEVITADYLVRNGMDKGKASRVISCLDAHIIQNGMSSDTDTSSVAAVNTNTPDAAKTAALEVFTAADTPADSTPAPDVSEVELTFADVARPANFLSALVPYTGGNKLLRVFADERHVVVSQETGRDKVNSWSVLPREAVSAALKAYRVRSDLSQSLWTDGRGLFARAVESIAGRSRNNSQPLWIGDCMRKGDSYPATCLGLPRTKEVREGTRWTERTDVTWYIIGDAVLEAFEIERAEFAPIV